MTHMKPIQIGICVANYKSFGNEPQGFDAIYPINLIVGRNNTGKSAMLDIVAYAMQPTELAHAHRQAALPQVTIRTPIDEASLRNIFRENVTGGPFANNRTDRKSVV